MVDDQQTGPYVDWDYCDCRRRIPAKTRAECGCGCHEISLPTKENESENIIHWIGEHWLLTCAMDEATAILDKLDRRTTQARKLLTLSDDQDIQDTEDS